jgi:hypothetical protein
MLKLRFTALILLAAMLISLCACSDEKYEHCELGIKLDESFVEYDVDGRFDMAYTDGRVIVGVLRFSFEACLKDDIPISMSDYTFAKYYRAKAEGIEDVSEVEMYGYLPYFTYTLEGTDEVRHRYVATFYTTPNAYFLVMYITPADSAADNAPHIEDLIGKIYFKSFF